MDATTKADKLLTLHKQGTECISKVGSTAIKCLVFYGVFTILSDLLVRSGFIS